MVKAIEQQFEMDDKITKIGYIAAFENGSRNLCGRFTLPNQPVQKIDIFSRILEQQPPVRKASYIWVNITLPGQIPDLITLEYKEAEIALLIEKLIRPGIIRR